MKRCDCEECRLSMALERLANQMRDQQRLKVVKCLRDIRTGKPIYYADTPASRAAEKTGWQSGLRLLKTLGRKPQ
jgi:hypothetical protein